MATLRSKFNALYEPLLGSFFDEPAMEETKATCDDCAMCRNDAPPGVKTENFLRETKCCTYHPTLPNYLVGAILADERPEMAEGKKRIQAAIKTRMGVTPRWLSAPRKKLVLLEAARYTSFGRAPSMKCPYYDDGKCSIWYHRETICRTFFCKYEGAANGWAFWDALKQYFFRIETTLTQYAADQIDPKVTEPDIPRLRMSLEDLEDRPPPDDEYAGYWASYLGREEEFYIRAFEIVSSLDAAKLQELLDTTPIKSGSRAGPLLETVKEKYEALMRPKLLPRLMLNKQMRVAPAEGGMVGMTYSRYDPFFMSEALKGVAAEFNGEESVGDTVARIKRDLDIDVPEDILIRLQMLEVLIPPAEKKAEGDDAAEAT